MVASSRIAVAAFVAAAAGMATIPGCLGAPEGDLVDQLPGFDKAPFKTYAGYLDVGPVGEYSSLSIAYVFNYAQGAEPEKMPVAAWHQGGPGGNSFYGLFGELGYFQVSEDGQRINNSTSWNRVANMLYLDAPAGSNDPIGFSTCSRDGSVAKICSWNDRTQAEAYAHTLRAFYKAFPEFANSPLYLTGESYAGQYVPNIAQYILSNAEFNSSIPLRGLALGNACWGGTENSVVCNGNNADQNDVDNYFGKGLISKKQWASVYTACGYQVDPDGTTTAAAESLKCTLALEEASNTVGPHNIYDIYDDCPGAAEWQRRSGKSIRWVRQFLRDNLGRGTHHSARRQLADLAGGYAWPCGGLPALATYLGRSDVQNALHFKSSNPVQFSYDTSGPASITLWPGLVKRLRVLIYNGDADDCVPYKGNEEWTTGLEAQGHLALRKAWHPWFIKKGDIPAGYATTYTVPGAATAVDFSFITIRLAGHMVPAFRNDAAYAFFERFIEGSVPF